MRRGITLPIVAQRQIFHRRAARFSKLAASRRQRGISQLRPLNNTIMTSIHSKHRSLCTISSTKASMHPYFATEPLSSKRRRINTHKSNPQRKFHSTALHNNNGDRRQRPMHDSKSTMTVTRSAPPPLNRNRRFVTTPEPHSKHNRNGPTIHSTPLSTFNTTQNDPTRLRRKCVHCLRNPMHLTTHMDFTVADNYDWTQSTVRHYSTNNSSEFSGFVDSKQMLDYTYHVNYTMERQQKVHNIIIDHHLSTVDPKTPPLSLQQDPWIIFTAGPMGAGKTHTLRWLSHQDTELFPLPSFIHVSADIIKRMLPEYPLYLRHNELEVGRLLRQEAGYLCEVICWEALANGHCIWFDSSFRHGDFFVQFFRQIRDYTTLLNIKPHRIGVIHVQCDEATVMKRAKKREKHSKRHVPTADIHDSIEYAPKSVESLRMLCDCVIEIDNSGDEYQMALNRKSAVLSASSASASQLEPQLLEIQWNDWEKGNMLSKIKNPSWNVFKDIWYSPSAFSKL